MLGAAGLVGMVTLASRAGAGPLDPPKGPVGPTGRTTDELFERTAQAERYGRPSVPIGPDTTPGTETALRLISEPGHYHLTANLIVPPEDFTAISVAAVGVTIDLNGFAIIGEPGASQTGVRGGEVGTVVCNGTISRFDEVGVNFTLTESGRVERVLVDRCGIGLWASNSCRVVECSFHRCAGIGLTVDAGSLVSGCTFNRCGVGAELSQSIMERCTMLSPRSGAALFATNMSVVRGCTLDATYPGNGADVTPFVVSNTSRVEDCVLLANCRVRVLQVSGASVVTRSTIRNLTPDTGGGITQIEMNDRAVVEECLIRRADTGGGITVLVGSACVFRNNIVCGAGLVTATGLGSPRGAVMGNTAFTSTNFVGSFDTGLIQSPVHQAANSPAMPEGFSAYGNVLGS